MKSRRVLVSARERQQFGLAVQFPEKRQTCGSSGATRILEIARVIRGIFRRIAAAQLGFDDSALKVAGRKPALGGDLKFRKLEPRRDRAAAQGV